jgi:ATP-dependent RNA helicase SUPV3L1/SUV3
MTAKGKNCALITGEERRLPDTEELEKSEQLMTSCTVEMVPLNLPLDVAVIDEIQMIGSPERGWAWTQALLGVRAKEVHLCGEERTVPLIKELCASVGEKLVIHNYTRLSPLKIADESLNGKIEDLRKGDCIVSFSVMGIHALRKQIERATGRKVATVYGSLPPETRAQQARLFNDPDNDYDFLVASDAVGMGLNLAIKRVIFEASNKFDGAARRTLSIADIKQIAGRAGRFRTAAQATETSDESKTEEGKAEAPDGQNGIVTTLEKFDFPVVKAALVSEPEPIRTAGIFPPATVLERFSSYFPPGTPFSYILTRLHELSLMHKRFHLCGLKDHVWVADLIEPVQNLTVADRNIICSAPASQTDADLWRELMPAYARIIAEQSGGSIVDIPQLPLEVLEAEVSPSREYLRELERLHKGIVTYLWLSYRFAGLFNTRALAFHVKTMWKRRSRKCSLNSRSLRLRDARSRPRERRTYWQISAALPLTPRLPPLVKRPQLRPRTSMSR